MFEIAYRYILNTNWGFNCISDEYYDTIEECQENAIEFAQCVIYDYAYDTDNMRIPFLDIIITQYLIVEDDKLFLRDCIRIPYLRR